MPRNARIRRTFTPQFKKDAVALLTEGRSASDVARSLGIARSLLQEVSDRIEPGPFRELERNLISPEATQADDLDLSWG